PAVSEGDTVHILESPAPGAPVRCSFTFPRQQRGRLLCVADFILSRARAIEKGQVDVMPFQLVTMGQPMADLEREHCADSRYCDHFALHGLAVQLTEALAEYWHKRMRDELVVDGTWSLSEDDPADIEEFFKLGYRGARYAFGY